MTTEVEIAARTAGARADKGRDRIERLAPQAVEAIAHGRHRDPFAVLGPHRVGDGLWEIRAMVPHARAVDVLSWNSDAVLATMERRHDAGFFTAQVKAEERPGYRLRVEGPGGVEVRHDPYSYGPIVSDQDLSQIRDVGSDAPYRVLGAQRAKRKPWTSPMVV
jgi:1,4-alpha-glucan branching enzyme